MEFCTGFENEIFVVSSVSKDVRVWTQRCMHIDQVTHKLTRE